MKKYINLINVKIQYTGLLRKFLLFSFILFYSGLVLLNYSLIHNHSLIQENSTPHTLDLLFWACLFISPIFTVITALLISTYSIFGNSEVVINFFLFHLGEHRYSLNYFSLAIVFITGFYTWLKTSYGLAAILLAAFFSLFFWF